MNKEEREITIELAELASRAERAFYSREAEVESLQERLSDAQSHIKDLNEEIKDLNEQLRDAYNSRG